MPRLGHKKSRRGCLRCKQRRVKCDENKPCSACARHGVKCLYKDPKPSSRERGHRRSSVTSSDSATSRVPSDNFENFENVETAATTRTVQSQQLPSTTSTSSASNWVQPSSTQVSDQFPYFNKFITGPRSIEQGSWITDLELMHQYTSATYLTLPRAVDLQHIWQTEVPRLALSNTFLLHQLLAISAHHQSHLCPDQYSHYIICASLHQNKAVAGLRTALAHITEETCHEVFVASLLLSICAFSSFSTYGGIDGQPRVNDLVDVFQLIRGMSQVLDSYVYLLHHGPLSMLFVSDGNCKSAPLLDSVIQELQQIEISNLSQTEADSICRQTITEVIAGIQSAIRSTNSPGLRVSLSFPMSLTEQFMDLFRQHNPIAMIIIAHYCVILHDSGLDNWFLRGWGRGILMEIADIIDSTWRNLLEWPLKMLESSGV